MSDIVEFLDVFGSSTVGIHRFLREACLHSSQGRSCDVTEGDRSDHVGIMDKVGKT